MTGITALHSLIPVEMTVICIQDPQLYQKTKTSPLIFSQIFLNDLDEMKDTRTTYHCVNANTSFYFHKVAIQEEKLTLVT